VALQYSFTTERRRKKEYTHDMSYNDFSYVPTAGPLIKTGVVKSCGVCHIAIIII